MMFGSKKRTELSLFFLYKGTSNNYHFDSLWYKSVLLSLHYDNLQPISKSISASLNSDLFSKNSQKAIFRDRHKKQIGTFMLKDF